MELALRGFMGVIHVEAGREVLVSVQVGWL
jgi:hypothetical protein